MFHVVEELDCLNVGAAISGPASLVYIDPPFNTGRNFKEYSDVWRSVEDYILWLKPRLSACWDVIQDGNMVVHLDWRAVHYAKCAMDDIAGIKNFKNEIVWAYNSGGAGGNALSRKHDTLLWYSKGDNAFNIQREPYATPNVLGRPGFNPDGRMLTDVWNIPFISTTSAERVGYPTQKPLKLLERIVSIYSNPGDLVVDGFCGSGTTGVAAAGLGRSSFMMDVNPNAVEIATARLASVSVHIEEEEKKKSVMSVNEYIDI